MECLLNNKTTQKGVIGFQYKLWHLWTDPSTGGDINWSGGWGPVDLGTLRSLKPRICVRVEEEMLYVF